MDDLTSPPASAPQPELQATVVLAEDLQVGDRIDTTGLGGGWDEEVRAVQVGPRVVVVVLHGGGRQVLSPIEVCGIRRPRRVAAEG